MFLHTMHSKCLFSSDVTVKPLALEVQDINVNKAVPENGDEYVSDPVAILKRITPKSAKYERRTFEQKVPSYSFLPFTVHNGLQNGNTFNLNNLPKGKWLAQLTIKGGAVEDTYFFNISKGESTDGIVDDVFRYTILRAQPQFKQESNSFETLYKSDGEIQGLKYFSARAHI